MDVHTAPEDLGEKANAKDAPWMSDQLCDRETDGEKTKLEDHGLRNRVWPWAREEEKDKLHADLAPRTLHNILFAKLRLLTKEKNDTREALISYKKRVSDLEAENQILQEEISKFRTEKALEFKQMDNIHFLESQLERFIQNKEIAQAALAALKERASLHDDVTMKVKGKEPWNGLQLGTEMRQNLQGAAAQQRCSSVSEDPACEGPSSVKMENPSHEDFTPAGDVSKEKSSSQGPRMRSLAEFSREGDLPLSIRLSQVLKKRKPGRLARRNSRRKGEGSDKYGMGGDEDWIDEPDVCAFCDDGVENSEWLLCCDGPCMRSFHPTIDSGRKNKCSTLRLTKATLNVETWICPNCAVGQQQCFACGKLGNSTVSSDSTNLQEVFVCGAKQCRRFYHPCCVAKLLVPEAAQNSLACRIQLKLETFTCPLHKCGSCNLDEDKRDASLRLIKCRRCPVAWHEKCLPKICRTQLWPLQGGKCVMYCGQHRLDPVLLTPERNHITFPTAETAPKSLLQQS